MMTRMSKISDSFGRLGKQSVDKIHNSLNTLLKNNNFMLFCIFQPFRTLIVWFWLFRPLEI